MNTFKKLLICVTWIVIYLGIWLLVFELRKVGTTWVNTAGGIRVVILALLSVGTLIPLTLSILIWRELPRRLYERPRKLVH